MTIRYKTTDLSKAIEYMRLHLRDKYFVSAYKCGIEYIVQISGVEEVRDTADTPQTDCEMCRYNSDEWDSPKCDSCSKAHSNYEPQTDCGWK